MQGFCEVTENLSTIDNLYMTANSRFYEPDPFGAVFAYQDIIDNYYNDREALMAYGMLLELWVDWGSGALADYYSIYYSSITDTVIQQYVQHLYDLAMAFPDPQESMDSYRTTIANYPNTEKALYAEVDLLTTALLDTSTNLQKGLGKVTSANFHNKFKQLMHRSTNKINIILPTEYTLHQNYPNPFNPTTTIQYDIPKTSNVVRTPKCRLQVKQLSI